MYLSLRLLSVFSFPFGLLDTQRRQSGRPEKEGTVTDSRGAHSEANPSAPRPPGHLPLPGSLQADGSASLRCPLAKPPGGPVLPHVHRPSPSPGTNPLSAGRFNGSSSLGIHLAYCVQTSLPEPLTCAVSSLEQSHQRLRTGHSVRATFLRLAFKTPTLLFLCTFLRELFNGLPSLSCDMFGCSPRRLC